MDDNISYAGRVLCTFIYPSQYTLYYIGIQLSVKNLWIITVFAIAGAQKL